MKDNCLKDKFFDTLYEFLMVYAFDFTSSLNAILTIIIHIFAKFDIICLTVVIKHGALAHR